MSQNAVAGQLFGTSVSLHEGIAIIGSGSASVSGNNAGAVQSFAIERFGSLVLFSGNIAEKSSRRVDPR